MTTLSPVPTDPTVIRNHLVAYWDHVRSFPHYLRNKAQEGRTWFPFDHFRDDFHECLLTLMTSIAALFPETKVYRDIPGIEGSCPRIVTSALEALHAIWNPPDRFIGYLDLHQFEEYRIVYSDAVEETEMLYEYLSSLISGSTASSSATITRVTYRLNKLGLVVFSVLHRGRRRKIELSGQQSAAFLIVQSREYRQQLSEWDRYYWDQTYGEYRTDGKPAESFPSKLNRSGKNDGVLPKVRKTFSDINLKAREALGLPADSTFELITRREMRATRGESESAYWLNESIIWRNRIDDSDDDAPGFTSLQAPSSRSLPHHLRLHHQRILPP